MISDFDSMSQIHIPDECRPAVGATFSDDLDHRELFKYYLFIINE